MLRHGNVNRGFGTIVQFVPRLTKAKKDMYSQSMRKGRIISTLIIAVILMLRGGDCIPLLLANQQTKDCCTKGKCSRSHKADPCCQTSSSDSVQHFQAQEKISISTLAQLDSVAVESFSPRFLTVLAAEPLRIDTSPPSSFGPLTRLSLPLLI